MGTSLKFATDLRIHVPLDKDKVSEIMARLDGLTDMGVELEWDNRRALAMAVCEAAAKMTPFEVRATFDDCNCSIGTPRDIADALKALMKDSPGAVFDWIEGGETYLKFVGREEEHYPAMWSDLKKRIKRMLYEGSGDLPVMEQALNEVIAELREECSQKEEVAK